MVSEWDRAPDFTASMARLENAGDRGEYTSEDVESFTLSDRLVYGPIVLAFFPGIFSRTCTRQLCEFRDWWDDLEALDGQIFGVSADTPWSQLAFVDEYDLAFPLLSTFNNDAIADYGVRREHGPIEGIAERAVFVIDQEQTIVYRWTSDESGTIPDTRDIEDALETAGEN